MMAAADNNRTGGAGNNQKMCGSGSSSGSGRQSVCGNGNCGSVAGTAAVALVDTMSPLPRAVMRTMTSMLMMVTLPPMTMIMPLARTALGDRDI
jgi:hypothetical protein